MKRFSKTSSRCPGRLDAVLMPWMIDRLKKSKTALNELIADVKAELDTKLLVLEARLMTLESKPAAPATDDRSLTS